MSHLVLFDHPVLRLQLHPLTFTRPVAALRVGIFTLQEKWERLAGYRSVSTLSETYLQALYPPVVQEDNLFVNASALPDEALQKTLAELPRGQALYKDGFLLAVRGKYAQFSMYLQEAALPYVVYPHALTWVARPWDLFRLAAQEIKRDFVWLKNNRESAHLTDPHTRTYAEENILIEPGAQVRAAILNAENGPIYLAADSEVQEGASIRGSFALLEHGVVNMGAKMRGDSVIGPYCKVGGEVSNSVLLGFSNKGHDGFLGNSVLGEWCNLGADTNTSNLKNNYSPVALYSYAEGRMVESGLQFAGLILGDHSKSGINTMFNTGTVVGVGSNIFGGGFPPKHIPSFQWGGADTDWQVYQLDKLIQTEKRVWARRNREMSADYEAMLSYLFTQSTGEGNL